MKSTGSPVPVLPATAHRALMGSLLIVAALSPPSLAAQGAAGPATVTGHELRERLERLDRALPALLDSAGVTGLSIAAVIGGRLAWARAYGVRSSETGEPVDTATVFEAASLSKPVFAYAAVQLVEQGRLDLDRPLAEYPPYEDIAHDERYHRITARMVLSHTTGFPNWRPRDGRLELLFDPGARFRYSGEGFVYLQRVVERITGRPVHELMRERVLEPLGMGRSSYVWEERFESNVAVGHDEGAEPGEKFRPDSGNVAYSLQTTAPDFARFLAALSRGRGLQPGTWREMLAHQSQVDEGLSWGLGVGLQHPDDADRAFWHWGHNDGYRAYMLAYPEHEFALVWFTNSDNGMGLLEPLLERIVGGRHPAVRWLDYERYDDPQRLVRRELERVILDQGIEAGLARYRELMRTQPAEAFAEPMLNTLGYRLLRRDRTQAAIAVFQLNVEQYPTAFNTYDSLGEAYMVAGDLERAIENYERSVELNPENRNGLEMLEKLRAQLAEAEGKKR